MPKNKKLFHTSHNRYSPQGIATFSHYQAAFSDLVQAKNKLAIFSEKKHIPLEILLQQGQDGKGLVQIWLEGWALMVRRTNTTGQKQLQNFFRAFDILVESIVQYVDNPQGIGLLERVENTLSTLTPRALHQETALYMQCLQEKKRQVTTGKVERAAADFMRGEEAKTARANTPEKECPSSHVGASWGEPGFFYPHGHAKESGASGLDHRKAMDVQRLGFFDEQEGECDDGWVLV